MALSCEDAQIPDETPQVRLLLSGAAVQTSGRLLTLALQLVCLVFATRLLGHAGFGDLAAGVAAAGIAEAVGEFGLTSTLILRFGEGHHPRLVVRSGVFASFATVAFGLLLVTPIAFTVLSSEQRLAYAALLPGSILSLLAVSCLAYWQYELSFARVVRSNVIAQAIGTVVLFGALVVGHHWSETAKLAAIGGSQALAAALVLALLWPRHLPAIGKNQSTEQGKAVVAILFGAFPLGIAGAISLLHVRADQLVLAGMHFRNGLANYAVAYRALEAIVSGIGTVSVVAFSLMSRSSAEQRAGRARTTTVLLIGAGTLGSMGFALAAPIIVPILGGTSYTGAVRSCRLLAPVVVMSVSNVMAGRVLIAAHRAQLLVGIAFSGLALNVLLNLLLIPHLGTAGAATATVTTEGLGALAVAWVAEHKERGSQPLTMLFGAIFGVTSALLLWSWAGASGRIVGLVLGAVTAAIVTLVTLRLIISEVAGPATSS
jgi:O-antigen/teichoic acid export membrane protein